MNTNEQMRAALEKIREKCVIYNNDLAEEIDAICGNALALPRRNCDVGTAEEQAERFGALCGKYYNEEYPCDKECPLASFPMIHGFPRCQAYWAQMPYEEEERDTYGVQSTP